MGLLLFLLSIIHGEFFINEFKDQSEPLKEPLVIQLDNSDWPNADTAEFWLVAYYSDKCTHCKDFLAAFERVSSEMRGTSHLKFGQVFCPTSEENLKTGSLKDHSKNQICGQSFFDSQVDGSLRSAREMIPTVINITHPRSVCDVGCGTGAWLKTAQEVARLDDDDAAGFDFEVPIESLLIKTSQYHNMDLTRPMKHQREFDLCISLEVADRLSENSTDTFVKSLISLAPVILFSAAIPGQSETRHANEQYLNFWEARFKEHHYYGVDCLRSKFWNNNNVDLRYKQNSVLFVREDKLKSLGLKRSNGPLLSVVHPRIYYNSCRTETSEIEYNISAYSTLTQNICQSPVCGSKEVQGDPIIKLFGHGNSITYPGKSDLIQLSEWISKNISPMRDERIGDKNKNQRSVEGGEL